jgi:hypothetical protein
VTRDPDFDELVGGEPTGAERDRLRRAHELLLRAGPPAELPPELEAGPNLAMTLGRAPRRRRRGLALLAAAAVAVGVVFLGGYIVGNQGGGPAPAARTIQLQGTSAARTAVASLEIEPGDAAGNWPMVLNVSGLPALPEHGYYAVYLVRNGKPWKPCGWFVVAGVHAGTTGTMNAPYDIRAGDTWVVTRQAAGAKGPGETVLRPTA